MKARSLAEADVQSAINEVAAAGGGTVEMPAGAGVEWTAGVDVPAGVSLIGQGDATHIVDSVPKDGSIPLGDSQAIRVSVGPGMKFGAFKIEGNTPDVHTAAKGHIRLVGNVSDAHVFSLTAINNTTNVIRAGGAIFGLVEKCKWETWRQQSQFILVEHGSSFGDPSGFGDKSWATPIQWGSFGALYIETSEFINHLTEYNAHIVDCFSGSRVVFRKNKSLRMTLGSHGTETGGRFRSMRYYEVYDNTFDFAGAVNGVDSVIWVRGGLIVAFRNKVLNASRQIAFNNFIKTTMKRDEPNTNYGGWGWCGGDSPFDQNKPGENGYYCIDQPGADTSRDLGGIDPPEQRWAENQVGVIYEWENELSDSPTGGVIGEGMHLQSGRDFKLNTRRPGYVEAGEHPLATGQPIPPDPEPTPPNQPPTVTIKAPTPGQVITTKNFTISLAGSDDAGIAWQELAINGQVVKAAATATMTYSWNTSPYKGKGPVVIRAMVRDAEGLASTATVTVVVKK